MPRRAVRSRLWRVGAETDARIRVLGAGESCIPTGLFWDSGLEMGLEAGGRQVHAWLLPDGFELRSDEAQEWTQVAPNLAIREPE